MDGEFTIHINYGYTIKGKDSDLYDTEISDGFTVNDYMLNVMKRGWSVLNGNELTKAVVEELSIDELSLVMALEDGEVYGFKPFVAVLTENIDNEVPEDLPNRTFEAYTYTVTDDETEYTVEEQVKTWNQWLLNYTRSQDEDGTLTQGDYATLDSNDTYTYYTTNGCNDGDALTGTELILIYSSDDATLVEELPADESE